MYIVRWLTGHPMIAVWVLGAIAILLSYGSSEKEGHDTEHKTAVTSEVSTVATSTEVTNNKKQESDQVNPNSSGKSNSEEVSKNVGTTSSTNNVSKDIVTAVEVISPPTSTIAGGVNQENVAGDVAQVKQEVTANEDNNALNSTVVEQTTTELSVKADNKNNLNNNDTEVADLGQLDADEMLKMAREAYWNNGLDEAAQIYQQLIKAEPKVVEYRGELGNVYWRQGYPKKAAEIYSEIAIPMIENGNSNRVANMIGFIGLFYPDRASVIHDRLQSQNPQESGSTK